MLNCLPLTELDCMVMAPLTVKFHQWKIVESRAKQLLSFDAYEVPINTSRGMFSIYSAA